MSIKKQIPNLITLGNLFCGTLAVVSTLEGNLAWTSYLVGIAVVLDFFDGFTARLLKVSSPIGKDLDSLADMVTFGLVPALVMFKLIDVSYLLAFLKSKSTADITAAGSIWSDFNANNPLKYAGLIIALFSALRLAKFNNDTRQSDSFIGVPTPANAIFICGFPLIFERLGLNFSNLERVLEKGEQFSSDGDLIGQAAMFVITSPAFLVALCVSLSLLLVSELPLLALKFKNFTWRDNKPRYTLLAMAVLLFATLQVVAIPVIIILYILQSIVNNIFLNKKV